MKSFSKVWKSSKNRRKQRKYRANAPLHIKRKMLASHLSKDLASKYNTRSVPVVTGDKVKIVRENFKGKTGTITEIKLRTKKVLIDVAYMLKKSGSKVFYPVDPSKVIVTELNLKDSVRAESLSKESKSKKETKTSKNDTTAAKQKSQKKSDEE